MWEVGGEGWAKGGERWGDMDRRLEGREGSEPEKERLMLIEREAGGVGRKVEEKMKASSVRVIDKKK